MADLGAPVSAPPKAKSPPPPRAEPSLAADDLEALMNDLAAPPARSGTTATAPKKTAAATAPVSAPAASVGAGMEDLEGFEEVLDDDMLSDLLQDLSAPSKTAAKPAVKAAPAPAPAAAPAAAVPSKTSAPRQSEASRVAKSEPASVDDGLDALLGDLANSTLPPPLLSSPLSLSHSYPLSSSSQIANHQGSSPCC